MTFSGERPSLRVGRGSELTLVVGTPGIGPGTFAMLGYEDSIPAAAKPVADVSLPLFRHHIGFPGWLGGCGQLG